MLRSIQLAFLFLIVITLSGKAYAQEKDAEDQSPYLFSDFYPATILFKSGYSKEAVFNYNVITEEMIYVQAGTYLALHMSGIDTIYLEGRKFVPFGEAFYEVIPVPPGVLYVRHKSQLLSKGKPAGYGGHIATGATTSLSNITANGTLYKLEVPSEFNKSDITSFWVRKKGQFHQLKNVRQAQKIFPEQKKEIRSFVKENNTNFKKLEDVMELLQILL